PQSRLPTVSPSLFLSVVNSPRSKMRGPVSFRGEPPARRSQDWKQCSIRRSASGTIDSVRAVAGTFPPMGFPMSAEEYSRRRPMHGIIYLIGLIVVIMFLLSLLGLR